MTQNFFERLRTYYESVGAVLRGEADAASVFANTGDIGTSRENVYAEFLKTHAPSKCNVFLGGFLFDMNGAESRQLDVIVTTDTTPRFNFHNRDGRGKSFAPVEGALGVASIKSTLDGDALRDALEGISSIPATGFLVNRIAPGVVIKNYDDWPYKILYASKGMAPETLLRGVVSFYSSHAHIASGRRVNLIHVAGSCVIVRVGEGLSIWNRAAKRVEEVTAGTFHLITTDPDLQGIVLAMEGLQDRAQASTHILYSYGDLLNRVNRLPPSGEAGAAPAM